MSKKTEKTIKELASEAYQRSIQGKSKFATAEIKKPRPLSNKSRAILAQEIDDMTRGFNDKMMRATFRVSR